MDMWKYEHGQTGYLHLVCVQTDKKITWTCVGQPNCVQEKQMKGVSASRSTSCLSRPPSHCWYLFETCHFPEPSQCASLDHQLLPSQFDSGDSSISGPSNFVLFSFFHFIRRFWNHILICLS